MAKKIPSVKHENDVTIVTETAQEESKSTTIYDYYKPELVIAFCDTYQPCERQTFNTVMFTQAKLREFFHAWKETCGDVLTLYIEELAHNGFLMKVNPYLGEPVILADWRLL